MKIGVETFRICKVFYLKLFIMVFVIIQSLCIIVNLLFGLYNLELKNYRTACFNFSAFGFCVAGLIHALVSL